MASLTAPIFNASRITKLVATSMNSSFGTSDLCSMKNTPISPSSISQKSTISNSVDGDNSQKGFAFKDVGPVTSSTTMDDIISLPSNSANPHNTRTVRARSFEDDMIAHSVNKVIADPSIESNVCTESTLEHSSSDEVIASGCGCIKIDIESHSEHTCDHVDFDSVYLENLRKESENETTGIAPTLPKAEVDEYDTLEQYHDNETVSSTNQFLATSVPETMNGVHEDDEYAHLEQYT